MLLQERVLILLDKRDSQCLEQIVELTEENLKENGIELEELLADGGYSSGEALAYLHEKKHQRLHPKLRTIQIRAKVLPSTKKKIITNALNPKATKRNCFSKAKKDSKRLHQTQRTEAVKQIVKTVH